MSIVIQWNTPDRYEAIDNDIVKFVIQKQTNGTGAFVQIAEIDATTDGLPKSTSNEWIDSYEDLTGTQTDVYQVAYKDAGGNTGLFSESGTGGYLSVLCGLMDRIRYKLGDDSPLFYQLDSPQYKWTGTQLASLMQSTLDEFNGLIMVTEYTFDTLPQDAWPCIEWGVASSALDSRSIKEIPNSMKYNDGVSFDMSNRPGDYDRMGTKMRQRFEAMVKNWKSSHRAKPVGMGSQRLPFKVSRPLSMLPNMQNVFGF
jgi:hypothetical protein